MELAPTTTIFFSALFSLVLRFFFSDMKIISTILEIHLTKWNSNKKTNNTEPLTKNKTTAYVSDKISRGEVKMVMERLGIKWELEGDHVYDENEFLKMFGEEEEEEDCLEEVKEAFDVFDENRDGFIDVSELQRVLCILGLEKGSQLEECRKMIANFDENGDGVIDFSEFVRLMDNCFSSMPCPL